MELTEEEQQKLAALRGDIQHAADQLDRGEGVGDFNYDAFLAERHRVHAFRQPVSHRDLGLCGAGQSVPGGSSY